MFRKKAASAFLVCALLICVGALIITDVSTAQTKKKKKKKSSISIAPPSNFHPTTSGDPGTVKYYFFPNDTGTYWKFRTIQIVLDQQGKLLRADTVYSESRVIANDRFSLQRLPLMVTSDTSYRVGGEGVRSESVFYVDDSVAMTVFNNSVVGQGNSIFLVAPVKKTNAWHEKQDDTTITAVAGFVDSVVTPLGRFDSVLVTITQQEFSDMRKYYAPGHGIIKTVFRSVGPSGRGLVIVTMEMLEFKKPGSN